MTTAKKSHDYERLLEEERLILSATELIHGLMETAGVSRTELARRLRKTKGHVSQLLDGRRNMTLRTLAGLAHALDHSIEMNAMPAAWWRKGRGNVYSMHLKDVMTHIQGEARVVVGSMGEAWNAKTGSSAGRRAARRMRGDRDDHPVAHAA